MPKVPGWLLVVVAVLAAGACVAPEERVERRAQEAGEHRAVVPGVAKDSEEAAPRTYGMGWSVTPARPTVESAIASANAIAEEGEYTLIQREVPWAELLAGRSMDELLTEDELPGYLHELGLELIWLVDPLDGLDRTKEAVGLQEAGRSIMEPEIRALHEAWVLAVVEKYQPPYLGLASEINTLAARGNPALYAELVDVINTLAPRIRAASPETRVFVSFQADEAYGLFPDEEGIDHREFVDDYDIDALGLSTYGSFFWASPGDIPDDYFSYLGDATDLPLIVVEGGWSSTPAPGGGGSPEDQAEWFRRMEQLLDGVGAQLWVMLIYNDIDFSDPGWGLSPERVAALTNFATMGIVDTELAPKPAYYEWRRILGRPWARSLRVKN